MHPESETPGNEPQLELPSLGFGRKRKRGRKSADADTEPADVTQPEATDPPDDAVDQAPPGAGAAAPESGAPRAPSAPPAPARVPGAVPPGEAPRPAPARPAARPPARPPSRPVTPPAAAAPTAAIPAPAPVRPGPARPPVQPAVQPPAASAQPAPPPEPEADTDELQARTAVDPPAITPLPADDRPIDPLDAAAAALEGRRGSRRSTRSEQRRSSRADKRSRKAERADRKRADETGGQLQAPAEALVATLPPIKPVYAAIITGLLAGLAAVLLAFGAARGCDSLRGTSSCGGGLGLLALVAILAIEVLIGANLLKAWKIADPVSTSFVGVGVVAIIAMLTFLSHIDSIWMLLVIPLMTAAAFALSWWVTVRFVDEHPMASEIDAERGEPTFPDHPADHHDEDSNA